MSPSPQYCFTEKVYAREIQDMTPVPSKAGISSSPEAESSCAYPSERPVSSRAESAASHSSGREPVPAQLREFFEIPAGGILRHERYEHRAGRERVRDPEKRGARIFDLPRQHEMPDHNAAAEKAVFVQLERARVLDHTLYGPFCRRR